MPASAGGDAALDSAKIEGLRFELDVGIWRVDSSRVALCLIDEADCPDDGDDE